MDVVRTAVPAALVVCLMAIAGLHVIWAFSPWPLADETSFAETIVGSDDGKMPPPLASLAVAAALVGGAVVTLMVNETVPGIGPQWLQLAGSYGLAVVLLARGLGGYLMNSGAASDFQRMNSILYSPLCIVLGLLSAAVAVAATRR